MVLASMSSSNKRLKLSSHEALVLGSLPEAKQREFQRLQHLMRGSEEDARNVFETLRASPDLARVVDGYGCTLLRHACASRFLTLEMIQFLVEIFPTALQHKTVYNDVLPLHFACENSSISLEVIQFLVEKYPRALEEKGGVQDELPLHFACFKRSCSLDIVRFLVVQCPKALEAGDRLDDLPLHYACRNGSCPLEVIRYLLVQYPNALQQKNFRGMLPLHSCIQRFKVDGWMEYASLLDRMRLLLPGNPEAIDIVPHFHDDEDGDWSLWPNPEEHHHYKEVAGLLLEEISLREQWEWARQVVEVLALFTSSSIGMETACLWATEWRDVCRERLNAIEARLADLENLLEEFREDDWLNGDSDDDDDSDHDDDSDDE